MNFPLEQFHADGYTGLPGVFSPDEVDVILHDLENALHRDDGIGAIGNVTAGIYAARNLLTLWRKSAGIWRQPPLPTVLGAILGTEFGLVRCLYFDKPPAQTWALPWHKDMTIAVRENRLPSEQFRKPTRKMGIPHVEAPEAVLHGMVTLRIHLDDMTDENGPLVVVPGSHHTGKTMALGDVPPQKILGRRGDVLAMRPLLAHCSNRSTSETHMHRRVLHLEFAASEKLPDGYEWHDFVR